MVDSLLDAARRYPGARAADARTRSPCSPAVAAPTSRRSSTTSPRSAKLAHGDVVARRVESPRRGRAGARRATPASRTCALRSPHAPDGAGARRGARRASRADSSRSRATCASCRPTSRVAYRGRMLNVHPALLPAFGGPGMYGPRVHRAVLAVGRDAIGADACTSWTRCTTTAPSIAQWPVPVLPHDDEHTLARACCAPSTCSTPASSTPSRRATYGSATTGTSCASTFRAPRLPLMDPALDDARSPPSSIDCCIVRARLFTATSRTRAHSAPSHPHPMPRALLSVSDKSGLARLRSRPARARLGAHLHRRHGARAARRRTRRCATSPTSRGSPRCSTGA